MKQKAPTFYEQVSEAVDAGDRQLVSNLYRDKIARYGMYGANRANLSEEILEASENAAKKDPRKFQQDILAEVLAMQTMLLHRVEQSIRTAIAQHDKNDRGVHPWGYLEPEIADELLPRYARITTEIFTTMKMIKKLASPPAPAGATASDQAEDADDAAQAEDADDAEQADGANGDA